ncbi:hypothetical protein [Deinococcus aerophilus]|uniref:Uncharacterized protein n=1 Tax=Deinococcus aerophilus TaxID=522488 RepID=A0ABQ2GUF6_9DEIO|nr:hypothetical protein [Deinococcus aerophilus]GGM13855.1 hypothetical protein GCM10010841_23080 [Deinococcus aerophilus]
MSRLSLLPLAGLLLLSSGLGRAGAEHLAPNLRSFKTVCVSGAFEEQGKENDAITDKLLGRMLDILDAAGIAVEEGCKLEGSVGGKTQLNLYYTFATTPSGTVYDAALEGWLAAAAPYQEVTLWRDSYFGGMDAGTGALQAADMLDELLRDFIKEWDSVH